VGYITKRVDIYLIMCYIFYMNTFGQQLKKIRKDRGLRQKDLSETLQVAQSTIANYEQGIRFPDEGMLRQLADVFGVSIDYLLGRTFETAILSGEGAAEPSQPFELDPVAERFVNLVLESKLTDAENLIAGMIKKKNDITKVYMQVLQPALYEIGRRWEIGDVDVSQEHYFSEVVQEIMARAMRNANGISEGPVFLGFSISGELHDIGIRMVCDVLSVNGWKTIYLGNNLPTPSILKAIRDHHVDVLGISVSMPYHINSAASLVKVIRNTSFSKPVKIIVGGRAFTTEPEQWRKTGADYFAPDAAETLTVLNT
jgi:MerR family transcriptional regulator, light-induced transcriptional regulator